MDDVGGKRKRIALMGISSLLLVAMVVAVTVGSSSNVKKEREVSSSMKSIQGICQPTDFKETCVSSLSKVAHNSSDPKELIKASFEVAMDEINNVVNNSTLFKELQKDPKTKKVADDCKELFQDAVDDLRRSFNEVGQFQYYDLERVLSNMKVWLSATITYQETCLDGFENTTGDASEKMRELLKNAMEMSSNGLAIVTEMSHIVSSMQFTSFKRRLLSVQDNRNKVLDNIDSLIRLRRLLAADGAQKLGHDDYDDDALRIIKGRRLLMSTPNMVDRDGLPGWLDKKRSKLLQAASPVAAIEPNVTVAKDGTGKYMTIAEALKEVPKWNNDTFIIYVKEGVYYEYLRIEKWLTHVVLIGEGPTKTRISCNMNYIDGTPTFKTATLSVLADHFMARDIGVENTAGAIKHQAVAIRVQADMSIFYNCHFDGYQDTLYAHTYRQFYRDCKISGTIDFVFGDAASFFQNCTFVVRKPLDNQNCIVTAQGRKERHQPTGIIIHKSLFTVEPDYYPLRFKNKAYLARPWKEYSKTIIIESYMEDLIQPDGWLPWMGDFGLDTCYYGEYNNAGPGANMTDRVKWRGVKTIIPSRAEKFMPPIFFGNDNWIRESRVPYIVNLTSEPPPELAALQEGIDEDPNAPMASPSTDSQEHKSKSHHNHHKSRSHDIDSIALPPTIASAPSPSPISSQTTSYPFRSSIIPLSEAGDQQPILIKDLERVLMEDITEDTEHNDMMSNIPDSNEASPAPADHQSPSNSMAPSSNSPSIARSPILAPIQSPTQRDGMADMSGPASSPGSSADDTASSAPEPVPADAVPPTHPTHSGSPSRFRYQVHAILSGLAICAALTM